MSDFYFHVIADFYLTSSLAIQPGESQALESQSNQLFLLIINGHKNITCFQHITFL